MEEKKKNQNQKNQSSTSNNYFDIPKKDIIENVYEDMLKLAEIPKRYEEKSFNNFDESRLQYKKDNPVKKVKEYIKTYKKRDKNGDWLVLTGGYGLGKTHLAIASIKKILKYYARKYAEKHKHQLSYGRFNPKGLFKTSSELIQEIRDTYDSDKKNEEELMTKLQTVSLLVIDDLGTEKASDWQHEKMYLILNYRYNQLKNTIITTNLNTNELKQQVSERVVERMIEAAGSGEYLWKLKGESYRRTDNN